VNDLAQRIGQNPILRPRDLRPSVEGMEVTCLLNPGVFRYQDKTWLLLRVAERPVQIVGKTTFPILSPTGEIALLEFDSNDPRLDLSDPRVINFDGQDYLTTLSHLRLVSSEDGIHFTEPEGSLPLMGTGELETYGIEDCRVPPYELEGFFGQVIFTNGHLVNGDRITVYYGAADSVICAAHLSIRSVLSSLAPVQGGLA
jgi:predicted GH43/DUF377 family glycosyl hydrolase